MSILVENAIIEECRKGDLQNFRKLAEAVSPFAFAVAFRMVGNEEIAAEITQDAMVAIWRSIGRLKSAAVFKSWMYRIVVNKCYDELRKKKRRQEFTMDEKSWAALSEKIFGSGDSELENRETGQLVMRLTEGLSYRQKAVFILSDIEGLTCEEVASVTGTSRSRVKANLYYARKKIGEMIQKYM